VIIPIVRRNFDPSNLLAMSSRYQVSGVVRPRDSRQFFQDFPSEPVAISANRGN